MKLAKENGLTGIEMFDLEGRDLARIAEASKELGIETLTPMELQMMKEAYHAKTN